EKIRTPQFDRPLPKPMTNLKHQSEVTLSAKGRRGEEETKRKEKEEKRKEKKRKEKRAKEKGENKNTTIRSSLTKTHDQPQTSIGGDFIGEREKRRRGDEEKGERRKEKGEKEKGKKSKGERRK